VLGTGSQVSSSDTVPYSLLCASRFLGSYEEALWNTVAGLGDRDTTCAIVGGIVVMFVGAEGIPSSWLSTRERLRLTSL
jgi:ADP-ribosylglycohydrolase